MIRIPQEFSAPAFCVRCLPLTIEMMSTAAGRQLAPKR